MYKVEVKNRGDSKFYAKSEHGEFVIDSDAKEAVAPLDVFLAALGSCMGGYIRRYAKNTNIPIDLFTITLEAELSKGTPTSFKDINVSIDLKGSVEDMKKHSLEQFVQNCPTHSTIKGNPNINISIV